MILSFMYKWQAKQTSGIVNLLTMIKYSGVPVMQSPSVAEILSSRWSSVAEQDPAYWSGLIGLDNALNNAKKCIYVNRINYIKYVYVV